MDSSLKKSDISKKILETRKQTEELKAQLQNLIDSGINSSLEYKTINNSHLDKENNKESHNKVQIIKSYDTAHSQHVIKPSSSNTNLLEIKRNTGTKNQERSSKKTRNYDVNKAREYIKKQREKRLEQLNIQDEKKKKTEIQKQKLQELHKKSLELVTKNVQAKRERSKSRERTDFVRPVNDYEKNRSSSQERGRMGGIRSNSRENTNKRGKSVERNINLQLKNEDHRNPNLLYPPLPDYMLQNQGQKKTKISNRGLLASENKVIIISGNSSDKKLESPKSETGRELKTLKPRNLFNTPKSVSKMLQEENNCNVSDPDSQNYNTKTQMRLSESRKLEDKIDELNNNSDGSKDIKIISGNSSNKRVESTKSNSNISIKDKVLKPGLDNETQKKCSSISNILEYKNIQMKANSNINLQSPDDANLALKNNNNFNLDFNSLGKPKIFELAICRDNLETFTKETQTNSGPKQQFPSWLQEKRFESNPLNFINTVKRKLQNAVNLPKASVDIGIQSSIAQQCLKSDRPVNNSKSREEIIESLEHNAKSSKKSDLKSFMSHKCFNLDQKTIDNIELIPRKFTSTNRGETSESSSESDTSKNIPEISSESGTSLGKNAQSVQQNGSVGLNVDKLNSLKLRPHIVNKNTLTINSESIQTKNAFQPYSSVINDNTVKKSSNNVDIKTQESDSKIIFTSDHYTSDFQSSSESVVTYNSMQNRTAVNSRNRNTDREIFTTSKITLLDKHSNDIPEITEKHSKNTTSKISTDSEKEKYSKNSLKNVTLRKNNLKRNTPEYNSTGVTELNDHSNTGGDIVNIDNASDNTKNEVISSNIVTETEAQTNNKYQESQDSEPSSIRSSKVSDVSPPFYSSSRPSARVGEVLSKSDSNLQYINNKRGSDVSSKSTKLGDIPPLKEPTLSLAISSGKIKGKLDKNNDRNRIMKNISVRSDRNKFVDLNNTNEIHLKFEAEIHLLNDFNESLRQFSEVEKAFNSLKSKSDIDVTSTKVLQNQDTQTSVGTKSPPVAKVTESSISDNKSEVSAINFSRGFLIDADLSSINLDNSVSKLNDTNSGEDFLRVNVNENLSNFENLQSHNFAGMTLRMFEQLIKDEDVRLENLKTILKIREQALLDRTKGELAWLEIQRKHLRETGKLQEASLIKKKQRGILVNHQKERHEMQRLKQMQKAASIERKIILKEQRNLIKHQLSTEKMLSKIKVNTPRERRLSGPLKGIKKLKTAIIGDDGNIATMEFSMLPFKAWRNDGRLSHDSIGIILNSIVQMLSLLSSPVNVWNAHHPVIQSHTESIRSETSFSRRSSSDREKEVHSIMSHTQSIVSVVSEVSGDEVVRKDAAIRAEFADLAVKLPSEACGVPISQMKRTLLMREAALQKRRKAAEELLQWHRKLLEEEKRITELESTANTIISQIPHNMPADADVAEKYQFKGKQLNQLWFNLTGCEERKFSEDKIYPMSQIALERFCKSAREYSTKTKKLKRASDSEVSDFSEIKTDDSENIPDRRIIHSASIKTVSDRSQESSYKNDSVPITTANDYTSDFDIESLHDIVNIGDMDVVDKSINQLIDNFSKIQDDISSLSIKQSLKSGVNLEVEESMRSEKTDSDVDVSVIETAKTSKGKPFEGVELVVMKIDKISNSSKTLSTLEDIDDLTDNLNKNGDVRDIKTFSEVNAQTPELILAPPVISTDKSEDKDTTVPSVIDENAVSVEGKDNLNKSQEILQELGHIESRTSKDTITSNRELSTEENQIADEGKDNLNKSEEILLRLSQSDDKTSVIASSDTFSEDPLQNERLALSEKIVPKSETVSLESQPIDENVNTSSAPKLSIEKYNQLPNKDKSDVSIENVSSLKSPAVENESFSEKQSESENDVLKTNGENVDLSSEIVSDKSGAAEAENVSTYISVEPAPSSAIDECTDISKASSLIENNSIQSDKHESEKDMEQIEIYKDVNENKSISVIIEDSHSKIGSPEEPTDSSREDQNIHSVTTEKEKETISVPTEEHYKETDLNEGPFVDEGTKSDGRYQKSLKEQNTESKSNKSYADADTSSIQNIEELSLTNKDIERITVTEDSRKDEKENSATSHEPNISEQFSQTNSIAEDINSEQHLLEDVNLSQESISAVMAVEEANKSQRSSDNAAAPLSKEDINSQEEKELDSLSSSTTASQSSMLNEKDEDHEKSGSCSSEEKSPKSESAVDVKKRVSEIMADANQISRGDKSPKLQDFYTTTYDLVSPENSPELGSPTEDHKFVTAKTIFGTEAEELLRKQLAIEQEIKQITEQQQKEQLPYLFVREIPNKPPPPYTPPSSLPTANVITIIPSSEEIEDITKYSAKILHKAYLSNNLDNISISENTLSLISKDITKECYKFVFDLCKDISKEHYKQFEREICPAWMQVKKNSQLAVIKPLDVTGLERHMNRKLKELFGYEKPVRRENAIIKWSRKKRDHVDEILVMESQTEEAQWTNYDKDELLVMNEVTNEIMNMLLKETSEIFSKILSHQTF